MLIKSGYGFGLPNINAKQKLLSGSDDSYLLQRKRLNDKLCTKHGDGSSTSK
jgi:hypothetical protein